jgi:hypothetical protein
MPDLHRDAAADRGKLEIARLKRDKYGRSAERTARLIDQLRLQLEELESTASEGAIQAEKTTKVASFERRKPVRKSFPEHLPRSAWWSKHPRPAAVAAHRIS